MSKGKSRSPKRKERKPAASSRKVANTATNRRSATSAPKELVFNKENYKWMGISIGLIALGLALMIGGDMPSPDVWDPNIIYSFRITVLGPFVILLGLITNIYAIFK